jgi:hypothetical protein
MCWLTWTCLGRGDRTLPGQHRGDPRFGCLAACRRDLAAALQALSQVVAVQDDLGEQLDESTVEVFGQGAVLLSYRVVQQQRIIQVVELLWLG